MRRGLVALLLLLLCSPAAWAHVGSKDVFETVHAGPYTLYVTVRPPVVIPGVATVEVRGSGAAIAAISLTPLPVTGEASKHPPAADLMLRSAADPAFFTGSVWMMSSGTWQVRFDIQGKDGFQQASVPVLAVPLAVMTMPRWLGAVLAVLGVLLAFALAGIVAAAVREARLAPGVEPAPSLRRRGRIATIASLAVMAGAVLLGGKWWDVSAADYADHIFKPSATVARLAGDQLDLQVTAIAEDLRHRGRSNADYLPDHGHLIHLYAIREPEMDAAFHLHPDLVSPGDFRMQLPAMPAGHYTLYGDVVHGTGLPETLVTSVDIPEGLQGAVLGSEDAQARVAGLSAGLLPASFKLPDGYTMVWDRPAAVEAHTAYSFKFRLLDASGQPAAEMQPYLGMAGHAAFVKADGTTFAHTHPEGSAAMADVMLANASLPGGGMGDGALDGPVVVAPEVSFPYGFPAAGRYRIFIQMKHGGIVETGVFDADVK